MGILHVTADVAHGVGYGKHGAERAAALDLQRDGAVFDLLHVSEHGAGAERAPQGGGGGRRGVVDLPGTLNELPAGNGDSLDPPVGGHGAKNVIGHG